MSYYRTDTRSGIDIFIPKGLYDDQPSSHRPEGCSTEVAFAEMVGGAIYGGSQNLLHEDVLRDTKEFLDETPVFRLYIYKSNENYDYKPYMTSTEAMLGIIPDYDMMDEVRYCRPVDVEYIGYIDITRRMAAIFKTLIYLGHDSCFDFERVEGETWKYWTMEEIDQSEKEILEGYKKIIQGDHEFIRKHLLPKTEEWGGWEDAAVGMNRDVVDLVMKEFEKKAVLISQMKSRSIGRPGWHGESYRHSLAARGVRTR